jgi:hypothetical protein
MSAGTIQQISRLNGHHHPRVVFLVDQTLLGGAVPCCGLRVLIQCQSEEVSCTKPRGWDLLGGRLIFISTLPPPKYSSRFMSHAFSILQAALFFSNSVAALLHVRIKHV